MIFYIQFTTWKGTSNLFKPQPKNILGCSELAENATENTSREFSIKMSELKKDYVEELRMLISNVFNISLFPE